MNTKTNQGVFQFLTILLICTVVIITGCSSNEEGNSDQQNSERVAADYPPEIPQLQQDSGLKASIFSSQGILVTVPSRNLEQYCKNMTQSENNYDSSTGVCKNLRYQDYFFECTEEEFTNDGTCGRDLKLKHNCEVIGGGNYNETPEECSNLNNFGETVTCDAEDFVLRSCGVGAMVRYYCEEIGGGSYDENDNSCSNLGEGDTKYTCDATKLAQGTCDQGIAIRSRNPETKVWGTNPIGLPFKPASDTTDWSTLIQALGFNDTASEFTLLEYHNEAGWWKTYPDDSPWRAGLPANSQLPLTGEYRNDRANGFILYSRDLKFLPYTEVDGLTWTDEPSPLVLTDYSDEHGNAGKWNLVSTNQKNPILAKDFFTGEAMESIKSIWIINEDLSYTRIYKQGIQGLNGDIMLSPMDAFWVETLAEATVEPTDCGDGVCEGAETSETCATDCSNETCSDDTDCAADEYCSDEGVCEPSCSVDSDCESGEECVAGECLTSCSDDANCAADEYCSDEGVCEPSCSVDSDCESGEECVAGECTEACIAEGNDIGLNNEIQCCDGLSVILKGTSEDDQALDIGYCTQCGDGVCADPENDWNCPIDCTCSFDTDCEADEYCSDEGVCEPSCADDSDCEGTDICEAGECITECTEDSECAEGEVCSDNQCQVVACYEDKDCSDGNYCTADTCSNPGTADAVCEGNNKGIGTACNPGETSGNTQISPTSSTTDPPTIPTLGWVCNPEAQCVAIACNNDLECSDDNECTTDVCTNAGDWNAVCSNEPKANDTECGEDGTCQDGVCQQAECSISADCGDGNSCTLDTCVDGQCASESRNVNTGCNPGDLSGDGTAQSGTTDPPAIPLPGWICSPETQEELSQCVQAECTRNSDCASGEICDKPGQYNSECIPE
jgi:hypothetical protein